MWKKTLWSLLSLLASLVGFYGVVRLGWTVEVLVAAGFVATCLIIGLFSGNEKAAKVAVTPVVAPLAGRGEELPMLLDVPEVLEEEVAETTVESPIRPARTFEWGSVSSVGSGGPSQF